MYNVTTLVPAICSSVFVFDNWMPLNTGPELEPKNQVVLQLEMLIQ